MLINTREIKDYARFEKILCAHGAEVIPTTHKGVVSVQMLDRYRLGDWRDESAVARALNEASDKGVISRGG